eukprot:gnl/Chilomastix_cuspidata/1714.p1 GENE.gnl/Chilomastix_cuspidata/1714~~gnl/Chilomastix_cuspidata/1714.p1  ORF type:complete len:707 (+),score=149.37 gnl/Chilomastix_cuspidata/1714:153-2273(+)
MTDRFTRNTGYYSSIKPSVQDVARQRRIIESKGQDLFEDQEIVDCNSTAIYHFSAASIAALQVHPKPYIASLLPIKTLIELNGLLDNKSTCERIQILYSLGIIYGMSDTRGVITLAETNEKIIFDANRFYSPEGRKPIVGMHVTVLLKYQFAKCTVIFLKKFDASPDLVTPTIYGPFCKIFPKREARKDPSVYLKRVRSHQLALNMSGPEDIFDTSDPLKEAPASGASEIPANTNAVCRPAPPVLSAWPEEYHMIYDGTYYYDVIGRVEIIKDHAICVSIPYDMVLPPGEPKFNTNSLRERYWSPFDHTELAYGNAKWCHITSASDKLQRAPHVGDAVECFIRLEHDYDVEDKIVFNLPFMPGQKRRFVIDTIKVISSSYEHNSRYLKDNGHICEQDRRMKDIEYVHGLSPLYPAARARTPHAQEYLAVLYLINSKGRFGFLKTFEREGLGAYSLSAGKEVYMNFDTVETLPPESLGPGYARGFPPVDPMDKRSKNINPERLKTGQVMRVTVDKLSKQVRALSMQLLEGCVFDFFCKGKVLSSIENNVLLRAVEVHVGVVASSNAVIVKRILANNIIFANLSRVQKAFAREKQQVRVGSDIYFQVKIHTTTFLSAKNIQLRSPDGVGPPESVLSDAAYPRALLGGNPHKPQAAASRLHHPPLWGVSPMSMRKDPFSYRSQGSSRPPDIYKPMPYTSAWPQSPDVPP